MDDDGPYTSTFSATCSQMETEAEPSTSSENSLSHMPEQDILAFGLSSEINDLNLPTSRDILKYYFFLSDRAKIEKKMFSHKTFTPHVSDKLIEVWNKLNIQLVDRRTITKKLTVLLNRYHTCTKHRQRLDYNRAFLSSINELFYIGKCKCNLKTAECSCGLIPEHLKEFVIDQHNDIKLTIRP